MVFKIMSEDLKVIPRLYGWLLIENKLVLSVSENFPLYLNQSNFFPVVFVRSYGDTYTVES